MPNLPSPSSAVSPKAAAFPVVRTEPALRKFRSEAVENAIETFRANVKNEELVWLFENCFPNTLDTTVTFEMKDGKPSTYVITGDIDAMWLRDSTAQVWPYLKFMAQDRALQQLVVGLIHKQTDCILLDPCANAFYYDETIEGHWQSDLTEMKPGVHERKWEIDSLCYPLRLAYHYWQLTGDATPFDEKWQKAVRATGEVFRDQQRKTDLGAYKFQRRTPHASDTLPLSGYGYPVKPVGLICSAFRPSDDATLYPFLIPANFFAVVSLKQAATMLEQIAGDKAASQNLLELAQEVEGALQQHGVIDHPQHGRIYAYEVNGFGSYNIMDDANIPSLLSLPYLGCMENDDPVYLNTRKLLLSEDNPFFFRGRFASGIGGPHVGLDMIWPMSLVMQALTSNDDDEITACVETLKNTHGGTGFMHETFHKDKPEIFSRPWFAWANTLFGELLWKLYEEKPHLLAL